MIEWHYGAVIGTARGAILSRLEAAVGGLLARERHDVSALPDSETTKAPPMRGFLFERTTGGRTRDTWLWEVRPRPPVRSRGVRKTARLCEVAPARSCPYLLTWRDTGVTRRGPARGRHARDVEQPRGCRAGSSVAPASGPSARWLFWPAYAVGSSARSAPARRSRPSRAPRGAGHRSPRRRSQIAISTVQSTSTHVIFLHLNIHQPPVSSRTAPTRSYPGRDQPRQGRGISGWRDCVTWPGRDRTAPLPGTVPVPRVARSGPIWVNSWRAWRGGAASRPARSSRPAPSRPRSRARRARTARSSGRGFGSFPSATRTQRVGTCGGARRRSSPRAGGRRRSRAQVTSTAGGCARADHLRRMYPDSVEATQRVRREGDTPQYASLAPPLISPTWPFAKRAAGRFSESFTSPDRVVWHERRRAARRRLSFTGRWCLLRLVVSSRARLRWLLPARWTIRRRLEGLPTSALGSV